MNAQELLQQNLLLLSFDPALSLLLVNLKSQRSGPWLVMTSCYELLKYLSVGSA